MHGVPSELTPPGLHQGRRYERTHLFLAASLYSKAGSCPVHVRNISSTGARIEGSIVPEVGDRLTLKRGSLEASANIVWKAGRKAGIAFSSVILVADWMARQPSVHQSRIDDVVQAIRSAPGNLPAKARKPQDAAPDLKVEAELQALRSALVELEIGLTGDVILVATHPEIQLIDVALQTIDRLLRSVEQK